MPAGAGLNVPHWQHVAVPYHQVYSHTYNPATHSAIATTAVQKTLVTAEAQAIDRARMSPQTLDRGILTSEVGSDCVTTQLHGTSTRLGGQIVKLHTRVRRSCCCQRDVICSRHAVDSVPGLQAHIRFLAYNGWKCLQGGTFGSGLWIWTFVQCLQEFRNIPETA